MQKETYFKYIKTKAITTATVIIKILTISRSTHFISSTHFKPQIFISYHACMYWKAIYSVEDYKILLNHTGCTVGLPADFIDLN